MPGTTFTITSTKDYLEVLASPLRKDGTTPGSYPENLTWSMQPNDGSIATLQVQPEAAGNPHLQKGQIYPKAGVSGTCTVTAAGEDENGVPVSDSFEVIIQADTNPTADFVFTQTH